MSTETHDLIIQAVLDYCTHQDKFEFKGGEESGIRSRILLSEIQKLARIRRDEIQAKRAHRRKLRNGKQGRPRKLIKNDETY